MTKYQQQILDIINASSDHLTAEQVYLHAKETMPKISVATVYNCLKALNEAGQIRRIPVEKGPDHYDKTIRHDHMICTRCGRLTDVTLEDLTDMIESAVGECILSYDLQIRHICPHCLGKQ